MAENNEFNRAVGQLGLRRYFPTSDGSIELACLVRSGDWRPLRAAWWRDKEACIIGADVDGNFLLRHCDGSVRHWRHADAADVVIAKSVRQFASGIIA